MPPQPTTYTGHRNAAGDPPTLPDIVYELVDGDTAKTYRWRVPDHERSRFDHPQSTWAKPEQRPASSDLDHNPFNCVGCNAPLSHWARMRGFTYCSKRCREAG